MFNSKEISIAHELHLRRLGVTTFADLMLIADRVERNRGKQTHLEVKGLVAKGAHFIEDDTKVVAHQVIPGACAICTEIVDSLGLTKLI